MIFTYKTWETFCRALAGKGLHSIPACEVAGKEGKYLVLKHDVETAVDRAARMAEIEHRHGHRGTYYVQAYLLDDEKNVALLQKMKDMGHEISYHYDVMDSEKGDLDCAIAVFEENRLRFEGAGFEIKTLCQHGNPIVERVGYHSNRDFMRSPRVQALYPALSDIMVDFKEKAHTDYTYYSDAGRQFKMIYDPITNDITPSDEKNIPYKNLHALLPMLVAGESAIVSTHPHRYTKSALVYCVKSAVFKVIKGTAKLLIKIPLFKRLMGRFYYLAKKI